MALNMDKIRARKEQADKSTGGNYEFWAPKDGKNTIRILPPKGDRDTFWSEGYVHFGVGPDNKLITCPSTFGKNKKCPVCEEIERLKNSKNKDDQKLANSMRKTQRIYMNIIDRDGDSDEDKVQVMGCGASIFKDVLNMVCDPDWGDITSFKSGRDVTITKKGKGLKTEYSTLGKPKSSVASEDIEEDALNDMLADLDAIFSEKSYEDILAVMDGAEGSDDDEDMDYDDMSTAELLELCEERGITVPKSAKSSKVKLITLLEESDSSDDEEDEEDEEGSDNDAADYEDMSTTELLELCEEREIEVPKSAKSKKSKLIELLEAYDEEDDDPLKADIQNALNKRHNK